MPLKQIFMHKAAEFQIRIIRYLILIAAFLPARAQTQNASCCCCKKREIGQKYYDKNQYEVAIEKWKEGKRCSDAITTCTDLEALIKKARKKLRPAPPPRDKTQQRKLQEQGWYLVKDTKDPQTLQKFIAKYPNGFYTDSARLRMELLQPSKSNVTKTATPAKNNMPDYMVFVKGGSYLMGERFDNDTTIKTEPRLVTVGDFYISKYEVTFDEYDAFCIATGRQKPSSWDRGRQPVINVSWYDAVEYCNWLSQKESLIPVYTIQKEKNGKSAKSEKYWRTEMNTTANGYRLPTESEWEYAAREGGKKVRFGTGKNTANLIEINCCDTCKVIYPYFTRAGTWMRGTVEVEALSVNALGLRNMSGNVWEWCWDSFTNDSSSDKYRTVRGGSWASCPNYCQTTFRRRGRAYRSDISTGFRLVRH